MSLERTTYAISSEPYDGWVKIGHTFGPAAARLVSMQTGNPRRLVVRVELLAEWDNKRVMRAALAAIGPTHPALVTPEQMAQSFAFSRQTAHVPPTADIGKVMYAGE